MNKFLNLDNVSQEILTLISDAQELLKDTKEKLQNKNYNFDLTSRMQLRSDCKEIEKYIKAISNGKAKEKDIKRLEVAMVRLRTNLDGIVEFYD